MREKEKVKKMKKVEEERRTEREIILFFIFSPLSSSCFSSIYSISFHCFLLCCLPSPREKENFFFFFFFLLWLPCGWGLPKPKVLLGLPRNRPCINPSIGISINLTMTKTGNTVLYFLYNTSSILSKQFGESVFC
jgi:hypothetical protein